MELTERQKKALTELINIGFAQTAASLSELTGHRVLLGVPQVALHPIHELRSALSGFISGDVAAVHQTFAGPVAGDALLLLDHEDALALTKLLTGEPATDARLDASAREVLTEVGNILLNACWGMFGNLLRAQVFFSVPQLHLEPLDAVLRQLLIEKEELRYVLAGNAAFRLRDNEVTGCLVIAPGLASLDSLLKEAEKWAGTQSFSMP